MKLRHIFILIKKDFRMSIKDWEILLLIFLPMIVIIGIGKGVESLQNDSNKPKIVMMDLDESKFTTYVEQSQAIDIVHDITSWETAEDVMEEHNVALAVQIPANFRADMKADKQPVVELILDPDKLSQGNQAKRVINGLLNKYGERKTLFKLSASFTKGADVSVNSYMLHFGLLLQILLVCIMFLPLSVGEEKEKGCLEALVLSPATMNEIIVAKVLYASGVCFLASLAMTFASPGDIPQLPMTIAYAFFGALCFAAIGIAIALSAKNRKHGNMLGSFALLFFIMPMSLKDLFPSIETVIGFLPSEWLLRGLRQLAASEATVEDHFLNFALLFSAGTAATIWSIRSLRRYDGSLE